MSIYLGRVITVAEFGFESNHSVRLRSVICIAAKTRYLDPVPKFIIRCQIEVIDSRFFCTDQYW